MENIMKQHYEQKLSGLSVCLKHVCIILLCYIYYCSVWLCRANDILLMNKDLYNMRQLAM